MLVQKTVYLKNSYTDGKGNIFVRRCSIYDPQNEKCFETESRIIATHCHSGSFRLSGIPYINHPADTVHLLKWLKNRQKQKWGPIINTVVVCSGWMHDCEENSDINMVGLEKDFRYETVSLIDEMSRNESDGIYNRKILNGEIRLHIIKLADTVVNTTDLGEDYIPDDLRGKKIEEAHSLYIPLAAGVCPEFHFMLLKNLSKWLDYGYLRRKGLLETRFN